MLVGRVDVLRSFSWSTNVAGKKLWRLLPPEHTHLLYDRFGREMAPRFDLPEDDAEAAHRFPNLAAASPLTVDVVQVSVAYTRLQANATCWEHQR